MKSCTAALAILLASPTLARADEAALQRRIDGLEARIARLEANSLASPPAVPADAKWKSPEAWQKLRKGMPEKEVIELLGRQTHGQRSGDGNDVLIYQDTALVTGGAIYLQQGRVYAWQSPVF